MLRRCATRAADTAQLPPARRCSPTPPPPPGAAPPLHFPPVSTRLLSLEFSHDKVIRSVHTGGVTCLDLDAVEQRYLLAGAADASIAVYDTQQPSSAAARQQQAEAREAAAELAAGGGKGAKGAKKPAAKPAAKGKAVEAVVEEPNPLFVFVNESVFEAIVFEAKQVVDRLEYLLGRCRHECGAVTKQHDAMVRALQAEVSQAAAMEGAAVEAFADYARAAIERHERLQAVLLLQVRGAWGRVCIYQPGSVARVGGRV